MKAAAPGATVRRRRARPPVAAFTTALLAGDATMARELATSYQAATGSRLAVICDLFHPAQYQLGDRWYEGSLGVAEEHRATAIVMAVAMGLPPTPVARPVRPGARCILAGIAGEQHMVGLHLLRLALEDQGWAVDMLTPPTPRAELLRAVGTWHPDVVGISAAHLRDVRDITAVITDVRAMGVPVMVGGPLFNRAPGLWRTVGADAHGSDARVAAVLMRRLLGRS